MKNEISVEEHNKNQIIHKVISTCICFLISGFYYNFNGELDGFPPNLSGQFGSYIAGPVMSSIPVLIYNTNMNKIKGKINPLYWYLLQNFLIIASFLGAFLGEVVVS